MFIGTMDRVIEHRNIHGPYETSEFWSLAYHLWGASVIHHGHDFVLPQDYFVSAITPFSSTTMPQHLFADCLTITDVWYVVRTFSRSSAEQFVSERQASHTQRKIVRCGLTDRHSAQNVCWIKFRGSFEYKLLEHVFRICESTKCFTRS